MTPRKQIYIGVGLCVAAVVIVIAGILLAAPSFSRNFLTDVPEHAVYIIDAPDTVQIEVGEYQVWVDGGTVEGRTLAERRRNARVDVFDERNNMLPVELIEPYGYLSQYWPTGIVTVPEDGEYRLNAGRRREVILTEPIERFFESDAFVNGITFGMTGVMAALAGIGVIIAGLVGHSKQRRRQQRYAPGEDLRTRG